MPSLVENPLIPTPTNMVEIAIEKMQAQYPNWKPNPASPEYQMFLAFAYICAETIVLSIDLPQAALALIGELVYQLSPEEATAATTTSTWEAIDTLGHEIPAGTVVIVTPEGADAIAYEVVEAVTIASGQNKTTAGQVALRAVEPGEEGNISGGSVTVVANEPLAWLKAITLVALPAGGTEGETEEEFAGRVAELARLIKPQPILPQDFANFARLMVPSLRGGRVLAIDEMKLKANYAEEATGEPNNERCITVIPILANGSTPSQTVLEEIWKLLEERREASFQVFVGKPKRTTFNIELSGTYLSGYAKSDVESRVLEALKSLLSPETWGVPPQTEGVTWINRKALFRQDVLTVLNNVPGFGHCTGLKINTTEVEEYALTGIAPLPEAGTLTISLLTESIE